MPNPNRPVTKLTVHLREGVDLNVELFPPKANSGKPTVDENVSIKVDDGVADLDLSHLAAKDLAC
jgi:hypothetical protein